VYTYDKAKIFSIPLMDHVVVFSTESSANAENIVEKALEYINTNGTKLSLYPPSNIIFNYCDMRGMLGFLILFLLRYLLSVKQFRFYICQRFNLLAITHCKAVPMPRRMWSER